MKNSGLANFIPEMCLAFTQISSIHQKVASKSWSWYYMYQRWLWRNGTRISVLEHSVLKNRTSFSVVAPRHFLLEWPKKSCSIYFLTRFSGMFCKWLTTSVSICSLYHVILCYCLLEQRKFTKQSLSFSEWPKNMTWSFYIQRLSTTFSERSQVNQLPCCTKWKR